MHGYEGRYEISDHGEVRSLDYMHTGETQVLTPVAYRGYFRVYLYSGDIASRKRRTIHRMVAEAFIPNPENKPQVNHGDGDKQNNYWKNLEWATQAENSAHACRVLGKGPAQGGNSKHAKSFEIELPTGERQTVVGLKAFCDPLQLDRRAMKRTLETGRFHKGYRMLRAKQL